MYKFMYDLISTKTKQTTHFHIPPVFFLVSLTIVLTSLISACAAHKPITLYDPSKISLNGKNTIQREDIVTLTMPVAIDVVYHNGDRTAFMPAYQANISYELLPGPHILGFKYQDMLTDDEGNSESIKSRTVIIKFNAAAGQHYKINFIPPKSIEKALALEKTLQLTISHNNKIISSSFPAPQSPNTDWFSAEPFTPDIEALFKESDEAIEEPNTNAPALAHLYYWWDKASESEKQAFRVRIKDKSLK